MASPPQASDISITSSPLGETSRMSISSGLVWPTRWSVTATLVIGPTRPLTAISDRYGEAGPEDPLAGILIRVGFVNNVVAEADAVTASEASTERTDSIISLRRSGMRLLLRASPPIGMPRVAVGAGPGWPSLLRG